MGAITDLPLVTPSIGVIVDADIAANANIATTKIAAGFAATATTITAGNGLTGGGSLAANRTLTVLAADATVTVAGGGVSVTTPVNFANVNTTLAAANATVTIGAQTIAAGVASIGNGTQATVGLLRFPKPSENANLIYFRKNDNSADVQVLINDTSNNVIFGSAGFGSLQINSGGGSLFLQTSGANRLTLGASAVLTVPLVTAGTGAGSVANATAGVRFGTSGGGTVIHVGARNSANTGDIAVIQAVTTDMQYTGESTVSLVCPSSGKARLVYNATERIGVDTTGIGFYAHATAAQQTVTGSKASGAALISLLAGLAATGLIVDSSTA